MFLQEQAERFFNAYEVLRENDEALIDRLSNSSGNRPAETIFGARLTMGVGIVCLAFSVELYIKYYGGPQSLNRFNAKISSKSFF